MARDAEQSGNLRISSLRTPQTPRLEVAGEGVMSDKAKAAARYNAYVAGVKAAVPPDKLLVFSADQGFGPLCRFLGVPEPEEPFPNLNDRASFEKTRNGMLMGAYLTLAGYAAAAIVGLFLVWWF